MCKICKCLICPINCPNYGGEENEEKTLYCVLCGTRIAPEEFYYEMHGFPYCATCLRATDAETLIRICEKNERECFEGMGFLGQIAKETTEWRG
jgi:hypothetical protein